MSSAWNVAISNSFLEQLGNMPRKVQQQFQKRALSTLRAWDGKANEPQIKKLRGWKELWRVRLSEYRLVYQVKQPEREIVVLMIGHRSKIYDRLGHEKGKGPKASVIADPILDDLVEWSISAAERGKAIVESAGFGSIPEPGQPLPFELQEEVLREWGIPAREIPFLIAVRTEEDLLALVEKGVSERSMEKVMCALYPPTIHDVVQEPIRTLTSDHAVEEALADKRTLESFLLRLDEEQKPFLKRFSTTRPVGPWMVKGGPGSGKSTVALYAIKELVNGVGRTPDLISKEPFRVLLTTYTKSLVHSAQHLLSSIHQRTKNVQVEVMTVDSLASRTARGEYGKMRPLMSSDQRTFLGEYLSSVNKEGLLSDYDYDFFLEEINWVILGENIRSYEAYRAADRTGRGRKLNEDRRKLIWDIYEGLVAKMKETGYFFFVQQQAEAAKVAEKRYDYVIVDEAQDLTPVGIELCVSVAKNPKNVFLTADMNQSIYPTGLSWRKVETRLDFRGKTTILNRNYRTTKEIWKGLESVLSRRSRKDEETLTNAPVFSGEMPHFSFWDKAAVAKEQLETWLHEAMIGEAVGPGCVAVLCPSVRKCHEVADLLPSKWVPTVMQSRNFNMKKPGIKVLTMHAAKGLQFPVVVVYGLDKDVLPSRYRSGMTKRNHEQQQRRLLFVACSRAMKRLLVMGNQETPSPFIEELDFDHWEVLGMH